MASKGARRGRRVFAVLFVLGEILVLIVADLVRVALWGAGGAALASGAFGLAMGLFALLLLGNLAWFGLLAAMLFRLLRRR